MFAKSHGKLPLSFSKHRMPRRPSLITGRTGAQTGLAGHSGAGSPWWPAPLLGGRAHGPTGAGECRSGSEGSRSYTTPSAEGVG